MSDNTEDTLGLWGMGFNKIYGALAERLIVPDC